METSFDAFQERFSPNPWYLVKVEKAVHKERRSQTRPGVDKVDRDGLSIPYRMTKEQCWTFTPCPHIQYPQFKFGQGSPIS